MPLEDFVNLLDSDGYNRSNRNFLKKILVSLGNKLRKRKKSHNRIGNEDMTITYSNVIQEVVLVKTEELVDTFFKLYASQMQWTFIDPYLRRRKLISDYQSG